MRWKCSVIRSLRLQQSDMIDGKLEKNKLWFSKSSIHPSYLLNILFTLPLLILHHTFSTLRRPPRRYLTTIPTFQSCTLGTTVLVDVLLSPTLSMKESTTTTTLNRLENFERVERFAIVTQLTYESASHTSGTLFRDVSSHCFDRTYQKLGKLTTLKIHQVVQRVQLCSVHQVHTRSEKST